MKAIVLSAAIATAIIAPIAAFADSDYAEYKAQQTAKISFEKAESIAIAAVGGGVVTDIDFDLEFGRAYYEIEVVHNHVEHDLKIDANTGKVVKQKVDY